jgi:hypothetical protein
MKNFKDHWRLRRGKFSSPDISIWWGAEEIKEVRLAIILLANLIWILLITFFGWSFFSAVCVGALVDFAANGLLSLVSSYKERQYRLMQDARDNFIKTLNRLALNKTRKSHGSKTRFED